MGELFAARGIVPVVVTSPMCRCRDTAQIAFGGKFATDPELREIAAADGARAQAFERTALAMIAAQRGKAPVVFVSHQPNIERLTLESIRKGEAVVARVGEQGDFEVIGRMVLAE
jgi:phosphohistidine phosphatase SixA